jgi:hypothetical protein
LGLFCLLAAIRLPFASLFVSPASRLSPHRLVEGLAVHRPVTANGKLTLQKKIVLLNASKL